MCNVISAIAAVRARVSFVFYVRIAPARRPLGGAKLSPAIGVIANKARYFAINTDIGRKMLVFFYAGFVSRTKREKEPPPPRRGFSNVYWEYSN